MDFNKDIIEKITKKGALKAYNTKGVKFAFKSKQDGHEFSGLLKPDNTGKGEYKGNWMGFDLKKSLGTDGKMEVHLGRKQQVAGQDVDFKLQYKGSQGGLVGGELGLMFKTDLKQHFLGSDQHFGLKNTLNLDVMKCGKDGKCSNPVQFKGLDTELRYTHGDKHCGAFFKFSTFKGGNSTFQAKQLGHWQKKGNHTFALDTKWNQESDPEKNGKWGFNSAAIYGQTQLGDNWKVAMKIQPELDVYGFKQVQDVSVGLTGKCCEHSNISAVIKNGKTADLTAIYHPNKNVDFSLTNQFDLEDIANNGMKMDQFRPAFGINIHD